MRGLLKVPDIEQGRVAQSNKAVDLWSIGRYTGVATKPEVVTQPGNRSTTQPTERKMLSILQFRGGEIIIRYELIMGVVVLCH